MSLCKACGVIDMRQLILSAIEDGWASPEVPYQPSIWSARDGSQQGTAMQDCKLCSWVWQGVEELIEAGGRYPYSESAKRELQDQITHRNTGPLLLSATVSRELKATLRVLWPWLGESSPLGETLVTFKIAYDSGMSNLTHH